MGKLIIYGLRKKLNIMEKEAIINNIKLIILSQNKCAQNNALDKAQRIYEFMQDPETEESKREKLAAIEEQVFDDFDIIL